MMVAIISPNYASLWKVIISGSTIPRVLAFKAEILASST